MNSGVFNSVNETTTIVTREREFRAMADTIANIIYTYAPDGTVEWANTRWSDYTRLPAELSLTREGWSRVVHPDDVAMSTSLLDRAFAAEESYEAELRIRPDGATADAYRWFLLRAVPMRGPDGVIRRWAGSATDVHDRRVAAEAVRLQFEREKHASRAFQAAALPHLLPSLPGLTFSAVYEPAEAEALVGGDWFDAFRLPDGRIVLSVGDVIGSGLDASITMSAVRQAIRGAAQVFPDPAAVLDAADRALRSEQPDRIVTAFVAVFDPLTLALTFASAGHPFPLVRHRDGSITELAAIDLPIGLRDEERRDRSVNGHVTLSDGALLVLYTDGLTESTRDAIEGEHRLREALSSPEVFEAADPAVAIRTAVLTAATDDVAILTLRVGAAQGEVVHPRWTFPAQAAETAMRVRQEIGALLQRFGATASEAGDAELIFGELLGNVVRHTEGDVEAALDLTGEVPVLHVLDRGPGFSFYARLPNDNMSESGRGLYITTMLARDVSVTPRSDGGSHARAVLSVRLPATRV